MVPPPGPTSPTEHEPPWAQLHVVWGELWIVNLKTDEDRAIGSVKVTVKVPEPLDMLVP